MRGRKGGEEGCLNRCLFVCCFFGWFGDFEKEVMEYKLGSDVLVYDTHLNEKGSIYRSFTNEIVSC